VGRLRCRDQIDRMIDWANVVYSPANVRFRFDPNSVVTVKDRLVNQDSTLPPGVDFSTLSEVQHVVFRGANNRVYELWAGANWSLVDLTSHVGGIEAAGDPFCYTTAFDSVKHVVFRGRDNHVYELWAGDTWGANDLTAATGAVDARGTPTAYVTDDYNNGTPDVQHVVFRGADGRLHELFAGDTWAEGLLLDAPVPNAAGDPVAYTTNSKQTQHVVFRDDRGHLHEVYAGDSWSPNDLTERTGAPIAAGTAAAFIDGLFGAEMHASRRQRTASSYPGRLVVFVSHGQLTRDFNFSNSIANYIVMLPGENDLAHEIGHFFHLGHTHGPYPSKEVRDQGGDALRKWAAEEIRNYVDGQGHPADQGASVFDGDEGFVDDTPPDPTPEVWAATYNGDLCSTNQDFTVDVALSSGSRTYSWRPARWNIMSYFDKRCPQFANARHVSDQQITRLRRALEQGNRRYLLTS
jgi:hypothetical protein